MSSNDLISRLGKNRSFNVGLSEEDVSRLTLNLGLIDEIFHCLRLPEIRDKQIALFFADVLFVPGALDETKASEFAVLIKSLLSEGFPELRGSCIRMLARFRCLIPEYRNIMLGALGDPDPSVRRESLLVYKTYCVPGEVKPLEIFEYDEYLVEASMNGALIYELRNIALETLEDIEGNAFRKSELTKILDSGQVVFWWSWEPYHAWTRGVSKRIRNFMRWW